MLRHWEHTEVVSDVEYMQFAKQNKPLATKTSIPYNTAVYVVSESGTGKPLEGIYDPELNAIRQLYKSGAPNRDLRLYIDAMKNQAITILAVDGLMGTGKTSTCVEEIINSQLQDVKTNGMQIRKAETTDHKVLIAKPHVNAGGSHEQYGFLPGDIDEKLDPTLKNYIQYFDRFHQAGFKALREAEYIEVLPLGFIRGLDAANLSLIVDECQNTSELISVVTRRAKGSRIFLLGDTSPFQIDLTGNTPKKNGLNDIIDLLRGAPYFQYIEMKTLQHIVRSDEVKDIVKRLFKKYGQDPQEWIL